MTNISSYGLLKYLCHPFELKLEYIYQCYDCFKFSYVSLYKFSVQTLSFKYFTLI